MSDQKNDPDWLVALYPQIRRIVERKCAAFGRDSVLQPTAVVNELWIRLAKRRNRPPADSVQAQVWVAKVVHRLLIDHIRKKRARKRGGAAQRCELEDTAVDAGRRVDALALEEALGRLADRYPRAAEVVELRIFGGLTFAQIAQYFDLTDRTIRDDWKLAIKWLRSDGAAFGAP